MSCIEVGERSRSVSRIGGGLHPREDDWAGGVCRKEGRKNYYQAEKTGYRNYNAIIKFIV